MEKLTKETFIEKIFDFENNKDWKFKGNKPAIIDCFADWCGPCKSLEPIFEQLSKEYEGKIDFYKIDTEEETELAQLFQIRSIPSIFFIPSNNDTPQLAVGAMSKAKFEEIIKSVLNVE
jgi:thioredoxin